MLKVLTRSLQSNLMFPTVAAFIYQLEIPNVFFYKASCYGIDLWPLGYDDRHAMWTVVEE